MSANKKKIATIIGARPQFIKAAALSHHFPNSKNLNEILIHTGQHYDQNMSDVFFSTLQLPVPNYHLNVGGLSSGTMLGQMIEKIERVLLNEKPDTVIVYGDTTSTLAGALAASKLHIPVAHVEAGLRSHNRKMPEEMNRVLTDHCSEYLFCPTKNATDNLIREGIPRNRIHLVGDVMYDLFKSFFDKKNPKILEKYHLKEKQYILATIHRAENTNDPKRLSTLCSALSKLAKKLPVIWPMHPRTKACLEKHHITTDSIQIIDPVSYFDMLNLQHYARMIATDSGGMQKEAYFLKVPCITLRDETEWVELVEVGCNYLTGANEEAIFKGYEMMSNKSCDWDGQIYGEGNAGVKILDVLSNG